MGRDDEPMVKSASPAPAAAAKPGMIEIPASKKAAAKIPNHPHDPYTFWDNYFKTNDESPADLLDIVMLFHDEKKFEDLEAAIRGYLTRRTPKAQSWMYEMLAVAVEQRKGTPEEIKTLLGYAAYLAKKSKNPTQLVSVADRLFRRGIFDKVGPPGYEVTVGELIDLAITAVPHRAEPMMMSINLALKTKDPARMADSVERLLSVGWPGVDQKWRADARRTVDELAKALREDNRPEEADTLLARREVSLARDLYLRLNWEGVDDLDIVVDEPLGTTAQVYKNPRTVLGGAIIASGYGKHPEEIYVCNRGFTGKYTVRVEKVFQPEKGAATEANLEVILHEGTPQERRKSHKIDLTKPEPVVIELDNGRRKEALPTIPPPIVLPPEAAKVKEKAKGATPATPKR